jgi:signal transduction histidine kinase
VNGPFALHPGEPVLPPKPRLLLVEDDPSSREYFAEVLQTEYEVEAVGDGGPVVNSGLGIPADALTKIFEPFEQGDPDRTREYGGLGLGLAISRAIIAAHGGGLTAESPGVDQGSTFRVRLTTSPK